MKLNGTSFETKDDYYFNAVNANDVILLILQLTSAFCAQVGAEASPLWTPSGFLEVGGPFRKVGGRGLL